MERFGNDAFSVLGFPSNDFNLQEPADTAEEILNGYKYIRPGNGYIPNFPIFQKIDVNGQTEHPLYKYLKKYCGPTADAFEDRLFYAPLRVNDVRWNFEQFVIDRSGRPVYRYAPDVNPGNLTDVISKMLEEEPNRPSRIINQL
uniref:Glutathione peroxidase n=1 Tax=Pinctada fucata TaxID=50426 RepID=A0A194AKX5_PINFU